MASNPEVVVVVAGVEGVGTEVVAETEAAAGVEDVVALEAVQTQFSSHIGIQVSSLQREKITC